MEERKTATSATFLGHVQRLLITRYLTPNDRLASRMLTSRHHATCYARVPPADALNARNADFSLRIN